MDATLTERLPFVRILDNGRQAVLEIPSNAAAELVTDDALLGLVRERGVAIDASVDARVRELSARNRARSEGDMADVEGVIAQWTPPVHGECARRPAASLASWLPPLPPPAPPRTSPLCRTCAPANRLG